jgi:uncharacterized protein YecE (DUF72 family)
MADLAAKLKLGCSGWGYEDWIGPFYPKDTPPADFLRLYSRIFDIVEVDSSFYRTPSPSMVAQWRRLTPPGFLFTAKFPRRITHELKLRNAEDSLQFFYRSMTELGDKLAALVIQLPPSIKYDRDRQALTAFLDGLNPNLRHAVEFRHPSWFREDVYKLVGDRNIAMTWSTNQYLSTPPEVTTDFLYLRMVGDRELEEFDRIQRDKGEEMREWYKELEKAADRVNQAMVFFNNHYAGFGPASVNEFRRLSGLMKLDFPTEIAGAHQRSLTDFAPG